MIRDPILLWGTVGLLVLLAFILLPTYERFKDAYGKEVDVDPNAPPVPDWLLPIDERTGKKGTSIFHETYKNIFGAPEPVAQKDPRPAKGWLAPTGLYEGRRVGEDYLANEGFGNWFVWPVRETFAEGDAAFDSVTPQNAPLPQPDLPKATTVMVIPPPSTVMSNKPSGVKTLPSGDQPAPPKLPASPFTNDIISSVGLDKRVINSTLPPPNFDNPFNPSGKGDKYVLKSSLVPCSCAAGQGMSCQQHGGSYPSSTVPGDQDGGMGGDMGGIIGGDEGIQKPFSVAFDAETNPIGYLNSFAAFSK
jgi:hypothetical protein